MLRQYRDAAWDQSPLFKKIYEAEFGQLGGQPFGAFICDYSFDHTAPDVEIMKGLSKIGAAAHAPFIAGTALADAGHGKLAGAVQPARPRQAVRRHRLHGLALVPRLQRQPLHGADPAALPGTPALRRQHASRSRSSPSRKTPAAAARQLPVGQRRLRARRAHHRGVQDLRLVHAHPRRRVRAARWKTCRRRCSRPTTAASTPSARPRSPSRDRREAELSKAGLMALIHRKNTDQATFIGAQTLHAPKAYEDPAPRPTPTCRRRLPYIFASCRFAHYLKCMVRDWVGQHARSAAAASATCSPGSCNMSTPSRISRAKRSRLANL